MSGIGEGQRERSLGRSAPLLGVLLVLLAGWFGWSAVQQWRQEAAAGVKSVAIIRPEIADRLKREGVPLRVVAGDARRTVIANF